MVRTPMIYLYGLILRPHTFSGHARDYMAIERITLEEERRGPPACAIAADVDALFLGHTSP